MNPVEALWADFKERWKLSDAQLKQFKIFFELLVQVNEDINLTTITDLGAAIAYHFDDSLMLSTVTDLSKAKGIVDVGSGGGFPGIPLKIMFPHLHVVLIEVIGKKIQFLQMVIERLGLEGIEVNGYDWVTFLRKTDYDIDIFCARASLSPTLLSRMFRPSSPYKDAQLWYWASSKWIPEPSEVPLIEGEFPYKTKHKRRMLIKLGKNEAEHKDES